MKVSHESNSLESLQSLFILSSFPFRSVVREAMAPYCKRASILCHEHVLKKLMPHISSFGNPQRDHGKRRAPSPHDWGKQVLICMTIYPKSFSGGLVQNMNPGFLPKSTSLCAANSWRWRPISRATTPCPDHLKLFGAFLIHDGMYDGLIKTVLLGQRSPRSFMNLHNGNSWRQDKEPRMGFLAN